MVGEWNAVVTKYIEWSANFYYSTSLQRMASDQVNIYCKPWTLVMISSMETFYLWFNQERVKCPTTCDYGIHDEGVLNEANRLTICGTPCGQFRNANCMLIQLDSNNCNMVYGILYTQSKATKQMDENVDPRGT